MSPRVAVRAATTQHHRRPTTTAGPSWSTKATHAPPFAALERAGLLRLVETRKKRGTVERWYGAVACTLGDVVGSRRGARKPKEAAARRAVALSVLEQSRQEVVAAMHRSGEEPAAIARLVIVVPRARITELRRRLHEMVRDVQREFTGEENSGLAPDQERWALTMTFTPILPRRRL